MRGKVKLSSVDAVPLGLGTGGVRLVLSAFPAVGAVSLGFEAGAGFGDVAALREQGDDLGVVGFASCREMNCKTKRARAVMPEPASCKVMDARCWSRRWLECRAPRNRAWSSGGTGACR